MAYWGEQICNTTVKSTQKQCTNKAYYTKENKLLCGVHSKKHDRTILSKNPNKDKIEKENYDRHLATIKQVAKKNKENKILGNVYVTKLKMMKKPELLDGIINVFPNFKHQNRKDGYGCARLSPKSLGPVKHCMSNLPEARNLENYHQFAKIWKFELNQNGTVLDEYLQKRIEGYNNQEPFRHKYQKKLLLEKNGTLKPEFSVYYDMEGKQHNYTYIQCRYFYCKFYEDLVKKEEDFKFLKDKLKKGYNLNIVGYDGYNPSEDFMEMYLDPIKPFGHEMVLYTMLKEDNRNNYPWNIYYKENQDIYNGLI
jgi:hypothetical protein